MSDTALPRPRTTLVEPTTERFARPARRPPTTAARSRTLPPSMVAASRRRIGAVGLWLAVMAGLALLGALTGVLPTELRGPMGAISFASLALAALPRIPAVSTDWVMRGGLIALVAFCWTLSFSVSATRYANFGVPGDATWTCVLLASFPLLIPARPSEAAVAALLGALSAPAGVAWLAHTSTFELGAAGILPFAFSPVFAAALGWLGSRYVYGLGRELQASRALGRYRLIRQLGAGAMGEVWVAEHARLARPAALKFISGVEDGPHGSEYRERFVREAEITASLRSPHTVEVFDFGVTDDGRLYYAMELLDGMDLDRFIALHGPMPVRRAVFVLRQILDSLDEAHARGLVHRDIKPANVFLGVYGMEADFVKVLDFGVAADILRPDERLTHGDRALGTPAYMAPEGATGGEAGPRWDVYSVGCVAFFLVTGEIVFPDKPGVAQLVAHVNDAPRVPSDVRSGIPPAFDALVAAALAKDPAERIPSARAFLERLDALALDRAWTSADAVAWWSSATVDAPALARSTSETASMPLGERPAFPGD